MYFSNTSFANITVFIQIHFFSGTVHNDLLEEMLLNNTYNTAKVSALISYGYAMLLHV
jgi:hypothetical protein